MEPKHATVFNFVNCNIKRHWEDYFIGDSEDDDGDDNDEAAVSCQGHVGTQTEIAPFLVRDTRDSCCGTSAAGDKGTPTYSEIQQLLIESQNFTIHLLCEKIGNLQHPPFGSVLNPHAEVFFPSTDALPQPAQKICLSELIDAEDSLSDDAEALITELEQITNDAESVVEVLPTVEPLSHVAVEQAFRSAENQGCLSKQGTNSGGYEN